MPLQATSGAASYDAFGGGVPVEPVYIEQIFSTYLYTGNGSTQTITNNIDLSGKGGLVWQKIRSSTGSHILVDTARGAGYFVNSNSTSAQTYNASVVSSFNADGFTDAGSQINGANYVSWTFREAPKFFDIVTYTGDGAVSRNIAHNLGSEVGSIFLKRTSGASSSWSVYHRSTGTGKYLQLNTTGAVLTDADTFASVTSTTFSVSSNTNQNDNGETYVAYLFAHNAGGFGLTGTDNVISCSSFTTDASGNFSVNLGYEPQWILAKQATGSANNWAIFDNMRGMSNTDVSRLIPNLSAAENNFASPYCVPSATGFYSNSGGFFDASQTVIYIAIRRGPMKVPTVGTSVFALGGTSSSTLTTSFAVDAFIQNSLTSSASNSRFCSRLQGSDLRLVTSSTDAEAADNGDSQFGGKSYAIVGAGSGVVFGFGRAPSFFDEVCYIGTGSATTQTHNLGVAPELLIIKDRTNASAAGGWNTWTTGFVIGASNNEYVALNTTNAKQDKNSSEFWNSSYPTASVFGIGNSIFVNESGSKYVAYLFATCAGVSKVGSYTGTGTTLQINCGFTGSARFVLIKRTDSTGDWFVWNSALGIIAGNDPYIRLNSTAAQVTNTDYVDTYSAGFEISSTAPAAINANGGSFIFLAIA